MDNNINDIVLVNKNDLSNIFIGSFVFIIIYIIYNIGNAKLMEIIYVFFAFLFVIFISTVVYNLILYYM